LAGLDPGRRPLGTEIQIEWRSEWQPENDHLKPSGIVDVLKLCRYGWTCEKCSLRANDIKMPDQKQRERPREESAPWTLKSNRPLMVRAHRTFKSLIHPALSKSSNQSIAIKKEDRPRGAVYG